MDADERRLVAAAQRDPAKFGELYDRHFDRVYAYVVRRVADRDAAEDVTADVFHRALAALPSYESRGAPFGAWLLRIAANIVVDRSRRSGREAQPLSDAAEPVVEAPAAEDDRIARLFAFVDDLPSDQRRVIVERFVDERSIRDIAARMGRTEGAVKQLQLRALQTLRSRMDGAHG
jgi:RNA polymerase sigma-70 factor (ECF subfamily)